MKIKRREFLAMATTVAASSACRIVSAAAEAHGLQAGKPWPGWERGHFQLHSIYTGVAESMFIVFPDGTTMLLDCGDHAAINRGKLAVPVLPDGWRHAGDWIARYVERANPNGRDVDYLVVSHFHSDHTGSENWHAGKATGNGAAYALSGFAQAAETLRFRKAVDRGWPRYDDPLPLDRSADEGSLRNMLGLYRRLQSRDGLVVEKFRIGAEDQFGPLKSPQDCPGFSVRNLCANGKIAAKDGTVRDLYHDMIVRTGAKAVNENGMSLGMVFTYGGFRLFTAGDFSDSWRMPDGSLFDIESELSAVVPAVDVAKANHHGHYSMPLKLVAALRPRVWFSCVWDQLHDTSDSMANMANRTAYSGDRLIAPGILPAERRWEDRGADWMADVAPESFGGCHVIIDVPPGGASYMVTHVSAEDEAMKVVASREFASQAKG